MVKLQNNGIAEGIGNQGEADCPGKASKIGPSTVFELCRERLSPFGGLLGFIKFLDLAKFQEIFDGFYTPPSREPKQGHYFMLVGLVMLLFIGFNRVWHFVYIQFDSMMCSIFNMLKLPNVSTYWRYMNSLGLNQGQSLLTVMSALRERVWHLCEINHESVHIDIDTTVETIFGNQQGGRKGHNTKNRGKKAFRPVLCFMEETREYLCGKLRTGKTMGGEETAALIRTFRKYLPACVTEVTLRGDGEFIGWESVKAAMTEGFHYIFGNKACHPPFDPAKWYKARKEETVEYNECLYKPMGWEQICRFVAMRIPKEELCSAGPVQLELLEDTKYKYRIFVTSLPQKTHKVIKEYDKRADAENLIGEAKQEGLEAIPSSKFASNYAYFQIVMLAYNIWRSFKMLAGHGLKEEAQAEKDADDKSHESASLQGIAENKIRIARLKLLFIAAKVSGHGNTYKVKYSQHDSRVAGLFGFMEYLDKRRSQARPWLDGKRWLSKHLQALRIKRMAPS